MAMHLTPDEAAALLHPRDSVGFGLGPANPPEFLTALGRRTDWEDLTLGGALLLGLYDVLAHPKVEYRCGFFGPVERAYAGLGHRVELVPGGFRQFAPILRAYHPRVLCVQAAPDDDPSRVNLSLHVGGTYDELVAAGRDPDRLLVVELNSQLPTTRGLPGSFTNTIDRDLIDVLIEVDTPPFVLTESAPTELDAAVAANACTFVEDGATLQTGIGSIPTVVATQLAAGSGSGYGIHSEMFTDGLLALHQAGKVTNTNKGIYDGHSVTTFALGSAELYRFLHRNDEVAFLPVSVVNEPSIIGQNRNLISINGAICVDLYGQIVAEAIDSRQVSGVGGHEDFVAGAELELTNHSLICMHSTATIAGERRSRILPLLPAGAIVSTPRHHTGAVVTEYGVADLRGLTVAERARALAEIAHPDFRVELRRAAQDFGRPPSAASS